MSKEDEYFTSNEGTSESGDMDEALESTSENEEQELFLSYQQAKARWRDAKKGRNFFPSGGKGESKGRPGSKDKEERRKEIENMKKGSVCRACGGKGHWAGDAGWCLCQQGLSEEERLQADEKRLHCFPSLSGLSLLGLASKFFICCHSHCGHRLFQIRCWSKLAG